MRFPWYLTAFAAAVVWGLHYPLLDHALKRISLVTALLLTVMPIVLVGIFFHREVAADLDSLRAMDWGSRLGILAIAVTSFAGTVLLYLSISRGNATLASLIEISYPVFVALFAYLLFREVRLNHTVLLGAALVFSGVALIMTSKG